MYLEIAEALKEKPVTGVIYINDFYPYGMGEEENIVRVPMSEIYDKESHELFNEVYYDELSDGPLDPTLIYDETAYKQEFEMFKEKMLNRYPELSFYHKEIPLLYSQYKQACKSTDITGVVDISDVQRFATTTLVDFVPPEGMVIPVDEESYYISLKRLLPELVVDYIGLKRMYKSYIDGFKTEKNKLMTYSCDELNSCKTIDDVVDYIEDGLKDVRSLKDDDILKIHRNQETSDLTVEFDPYFDFMYRRGFRELEARKLLVYSKGLVDEYIEKLRNNTGISAGSRYFLVSTNVYRPAAVDRSPF